MSSVRRLISAQSLARAAAELVLIVAGILIALFLDSWWQDRGEVERERTALAQIRQDLVQDSVDMMRGGVRTYSGYERAGRWFEAHIGREVSRDSAASVLKELVTNHLYQPQRSGYLGLRDSGRLDLIRDEALRTDLVRYYEESQQELVALTEWMSAVRRDVRDASVPYWTMAPIPPGEQHFRIRLLADWSTIDDDPLLYSRVIELAAMGESVISEGFGYSTYFAQNADLRARIDAQLEVR
jgi:hypothetical protein